MSNAHAVMELVGILVGTISGSIVMVLLIALVAGGIHSLLDLIELKE